MIKETSDERIAICRECGHHSSKHDVMRWDEHCTICGCPLKALTKCLSCNCSLEEIDEQPLWGAVINWREEEQLNIEEDESEN